MKTVIREPVKAGTIKAIPSKSVAHRSLICAHLSGIDISGICEDVSEDLAATTDCLRAFGEGEAAQEDIDRRGWRSLDCRESGSTLRFMLPLCAAAGGSFRLTGSERLMARPLSELEEVLEDHGCRIEHGDRKVEIRGKLSGGEFLIPGNVSSQYVTGLMFALPMLEEDSVIRVRGRLQSRPYIDLTLNALQEAGIVVRETAAGDSAAASEGGTEETVFEIPGRQNYRLKDLRREDIEGDWSNASFWLVAKALGADIRCIGLKDDSKQADRAILDVISRCKGKDEVAIDVGDCPDLVPAIVVLAAGRKRGAITRIENAGRLRMKESDRILSVVTTLRDLGATVENEGDEIRITGSERLKGGKVGSFNDHRIVMMAALCAVICDGPVTIENSEAVRKSYPGFFADYRSLGGEIEEYDR